MSIIYSLWNSQPGCDAQSPQDSGPKPDSTSSQHEWPESTDLLVLLELLGEGGPQLSEKFLQGWRRGTSKVKDVGIACKVIQTLVLERRNPEKFPYQCCLLSSSSRRGGGDTDRLSPMWGPDPQESSVCLQPGWVGRGLRGLVWQLWAAPRPVREEWLMNSRTSWG